MKKKIVKQFDATSAKNGAKVETKDGHSARIICYDKVGNNYPIVVLLNINDVECCASYTIDGELHDDNDFDGYNHDLDLVIIEEIEYKFDKGDYIVGEVGIVYKITRIDDMYHTKQLSSGYEQRWTIEDIDRVFHKWTLSDAKPGDVLCYADGRPFMLKEIRDGHPVAYFGIDYEGTILIGNGMIWTHKPVRPSTFREYNNLFKQLRHENYEYDVHTHEITKQEIAWRNNDNVTITGYYILRNSRITYIQDQGNIKENYNIFATEKQAKSALAMARISQIIANDERFGGVVTDEEWRNKQWTKIVKIENKLIITINFSYGFLAFHTREQAELFLKENEDLIKDYYMLD